MFRFSTAALVVLTTAFLNGCASSTTQMPAAVGMTATMPTTIDRFIDPTITGAERKTIEHILLSKNIDLTHVSPDHLTVAIAYEGASGNLIGVAANRPLVHSMASQARSIGADLYQRTDGSTFAAEPSQHLLPLVQNRAIEYGDESPSRGGGFYRKRFDQIGGSSAEAAALNLPCQDLVQKYEQGYVHLGNASDGLTSMTVESGLQFGQSGYTPYLRLTNVLSQSNGFFYLSNGNLASETAPSSNQGTYSCATQSNMNIDLLFAVEEVPYIDSNSQEHNEIAFINYPYSVVPTTSNQIVLFGVIVGPMPTGGGTPVQASNEPSAADTYPLAGWSQNCVNCYLSQTTTLADSKGDQYNTGSVFGPVEWSYANLGGNYFEAPPNTGCINYPSWTSPSDYNQCYSTPATATSLVINVDYKDASDETVTIANVGSVPIPTPTSPVRLPNVP